MIEKTVLDNGVRILTESIPGTYSATVGFWVENGSRHETPDQNGISHFIEHMLFKGTLRHSALTIAKKIDAMGGALNAFTNQEYSCYLAKVESRKLPQAIDLLSDVLLNAIFDLDDIERERRVILQEIHGLADNSDELAHDQFNRIYWQGHGLGQPVIGTMKTVSALTREQLLNFVEDRLHATNLLICVAGQVHHAEVVDQLSVFFSALQAGQRPERTVPKPSFRQVVGRFKELEQIHLCLGTPAPSQSSPERYAAHVLNAVLGGSMSSRLFQVLREQHGLAYAIYSYLNSHSDCGAQVIYAGISPADLNVTMTLILHELRQLRALGISREELNFAIDKLSGQFLLSLENTEHRMTRLARNHMFLGYVQSPREVLDSFRQVRLEDVQALARDMFQDEYLHLVMVGKVPKEGYPLVDLTVED
jgi:predicted Zn-dependent peptidase